MARSTSRRAFTIVELLVAMALIVLIMAVMAEAFRAGLEAFRQLKAIGDMQERLRTATTVMRRDLQARHFEGDRKLSDDDLFWLPPTQGGIGGRPTQGFFRIQGFLSVREGYDGDNIPSDRILPGSLVPGATYPVLHMAVKLAPERGDALTRDNILSTLVTGNVAPVPVLQAIGSDGPTAFQVLGGLANTPPSVLHNSPWAEISYFPVLTGETADGGNTPLFALYRRVRLVPSPTVATALNQAGILGTALPDFYGVSCQVDPTSGNLYFNSEFDLAQPPNPVPGANPIQPKRRAMMDPTGVFSAPTPLGPASGEPLILSTDDLILQDVIDFRVQVLVAGFPDFQSMVDPVTGAVLYPNAVYDSATISPAQARILALKITLRIWDLKTKQTRQVTFFQEM
jgi:type II secretory pathway pseudopilin PulG